MSNPSESCDHDCASCGAVCSSRGAPSRESLLAKPNAGSSVGRVIAVCSGKGGVGKSLVASMLAVLMRRRGYRVGIMDADVTGPSIPKAFGLDAPVEGNGSGMVPPLTREGIAVMSVNLLLEDATQPVIWRGPLLAGTVKQFWTDTVWDRIDYLFVDCPPGTGDVPLTLFQSLPLDGVVIVSSPQDLVAMIVAKASNMAEMMHVPILGLIENMSFIRCPGCGREIRLFGDSRIEEIAEQTGHRLLAKVPIDPVLSALCDEGRIEDMDNAYLDGAVDQIERLCPVPKRD